MQPLLPLSKYPGYDRPLRRSTWGCADHYIMCCRSELWGCASLLMIGKKVTDHPNHALLCVLTRLVVDEEGWSGEVQKDITLNQIMRFARDSGYIAADSGFEISPEEFRKNFLEIHDGMEQSKEFSILKNGLPHNDRDILRQDEIQSVTCFVNNWNSRQYFCETRTGWLFFTWGTSA